MRIAKVTIENYRAIERASMAFGEVTTIIGENNAGKSTFLQAIDLFFAPSPRVSHRDFHRDRTESPVQITIAFDQLTSDEKIQFQSNLLDDSLIVTRSFYGDGTGESGKLSVDVLANADFSEFRDSPSKSEKMKIYRDVLKPKYDLETARAADDAASILDKWETENPGELTRIRIGGFRGATNVGLGQLKSKTEFILVPAVENVSDRVNDKKSSPVILLLDAITKQTIENNPDFAKFREETNERLVELTSPDKISALQDISTGLTSVLQEFYRRSELIASWQPPGEVSLGLPSAKIEVRDYGHQTEIDAVGHGLQRAAFLSILRFVADHQAQREDTDTDFSSPQSDLILGIEEPELYQHPTKQRLFRNVLQSLASGFSKTTGIRIQIVYATHSPLLVDLKKCSDIRLIRRVGEEDHAPIQIKATTLEICSKQTAHYNGIDLEKAYSAAQYGATLHVFTPEIAEGFFAKCVVLVEGVSDRSIIEAAYNAEGRDPLSEGIFIVNVEGKTKLDKPAVIFQSLGVPVFLVFDNDQKKQNSDAEINSIRYNKLLQRIAGIEDEPEDWPSGVHDKYIAWSGNIEEYVKGIVEEQIYEKAKKDIVAKFDVDSKDGVKSPVIAQALLQQFAQSGHQFPDLTEIIQRVDRLMMSTAQE